MFQYYTMITLLSGMALVALAILVYENNRLKETEKKKFYLTYVTIFLAMLMEWLAMILNGAPDWTREIHAFVKCMNYILTPAAGVCFVYQVAVKSKLQTVIFPLLGLNALFEVASIFTGWGFYLDEANYYHHGPYYSVYMVIYCGVIVAILTEFTQYGKKFGRQNRMSLHAIALMFCVSILGQEILRHHTVFTTMTFASVLMFVHYSEFTQLRNDSYLSNQRKMLETDALTGLYSRYAYVETLEQYENRKKLPKNLVIFSIDVNGLKTINDTQGHLAGDELIKGAASCISKVIKPYGKCFRTGGDEFMAILEVEGAMIVTLQQELRAASESWKGELAPELSFSIGAGIYRKDPVDSIIKLIEIADAEMYKDKNEYYRRTGKERRISAV